ncbi:hypothetical protein DWV00_03365 [Trinickia dinghuensis]|uniref:Uncharacterized protein n=1 Tax=Trinickia dinghuensis TaxID=2291023 RepID=A0A3D8K6G1_9BURK|nr:hypothetical protein DWV00_03365 [Trinickia dinghuensis]
MRPGEYKNLTAREVPKTLTFTPAAGKRLEHLRSRARTNREWNLLGATCPSEQKTTANAHVFVSYWCYVVLS